MAERGHLASHAPAYEKAAPPRRSVLQGSPRRANGRRLALFSRLCLTGLPFLLGRRLLPGWTLMGAGSQLVRGAGNHQNIFTPWLLLGNRLKQRRERTAI